MKRRAFLLLGGAAAAWPLGGSTAAGKRPVVGYLVPGTQAAYSAWIAGFVQRMRELGWKDDDNVEIIYRATEGVKERYAEIAAEFVKLKVDVIVTSGSEGVVAAKQATSAIPIVFAGTADPVATGLVESLAHPGGNITGLSVESTDFAGKEVELLRELVPGLQRLAVLTNADSPGMMAETAKVQAAARTAGLEVVTLAVRRGEEITAAFDGLKNKADAIYCVPGPLASTNRARIVTLALAAKLPAIYGSRNDIEAGGLISYGPDVPDLFRRAANIVDKILRGAKPADIPVEQPTKLLLFVNLTTAKALGLVIPQSILLRADDVIE
jgi:putative tryptophan/tyrosine transport system substrate-binding protein